MREVSRAHTQRYPVMATDHSAAQSDEIAKTQAEPTSTASKSNVHSSPARALIPVPQIPLPVHVPVGLPPSFERDSFTSTAFSDLIDRSVHAATARATANTAAGKAFFQMLGVFAEFETNIRRERQMVGIEAAKKRGVYAGRPKKVDSEEVKKLEAKGMTIPQIAEQLGVSRATVYRALGKI